jgi:nucleoside-diphosphate-sugar epimerase
VRVRDVVERVRDLISPGMELVFGEIPFRPDQIMYMQADISRLKDATGWRPRVSIEQGLSQTVAWYREHRT